MTEQPVQQPVKRRPSRKPGYAIAVIVNAIILFLVNASPGWESIGFLSPSFADVLWLVNLSLTASLLVNVAYLIYDGPWFRHLGQIVVNIIGMVVAYRLLVVFPFDLDGGWELLTRGVLIIAFFGSAIGAVVELVRLLRRAV